jgi:hypothetical protein
MYSLSTWVNEQKNKKMNENKNNNFINENFETFAIDRNLGNFKYIIQKFQINYQPIPFFFEFFVHMIFLGK